MSNTATAPAKAPITDQRVRSAENPAALVSEFDVAAHHEEIAQVAYYNWLERADGPGSPEQDWLKAEGEIQARYSR